MAAGFGVLAAYVATVIAIIVSVWFIFPRQEWVQGAPGVHRLEDRAGVHEGEDDEGGGPVHAHHETRPMTRKEILKAEKKKQKADRRAFLEAEREAKEERRQRREEVQRERDALKEEAEVQKQFEIDRRAEEEGLKGRENLEKGAFELKNLSQLSAASYDALRRDVLECLRLTKITSIEIMAIKFKLKASECLKLIGGLERNGEIAGVLDERGNYVRIDAKEIETVAAFVRKRDRISPDAMNEEVNRIVSLFPDDTMMRS